MAKKIMKIIEKYLKDNISNAFNNILEPIILKKNIFIIIFIV